MRITEFLVPQAINLDLKAQTKKDVLLELLQPLQQAGRISDAKKMVEVLLEREELGSTGIGGRIAIPHGKAAQVKDLAASFGVSKAGVAFDALDAHARDELGITRALGARPIQAACASIASFAVGAALPLIAILLAPAEGLIVFVSGASLVFLMLLGALAARAGGANIVRGALRLTCCGAVAMGVTMAVGAWFGTIA